MVAQHRMAKFHAYSLEWIYYMYSQRLNQVTADSCLDQGWFFLFDHFSVSIKSLRWAITAISKIVILSWRIWRWGLWLATALWCKLLPVTSSTKLDFSWFFTAQLSVIFMNLSSNLLVTWIFVFCNILVCDGWVSGDPYHITTSGYFLKIGSLSSLHLSPSLWSVCLLLLFFSFGCISHIFHLFLSIQVYLSFATFVPSLDFFPFFKLIALFSLCTVISQL